MKHSFSINFLLKLLFSVFLLLLPLILWLFAISNIYSILFAIPATGEEKILLDTLYAPSSRIDLEKVPGYEKDRIFEIKSVEDGGRFLYVKTNHPSSIVNEPYFHTTAQLLFRKYGIDITQATRWERTTKCAQLTSFGTVLFLGIFILLATFCLISYYPLLAFILTLLRSIDIK